MIGFRQFIESAQSGTFAAVKPVDNDAKRLVNMMKLHGIPNPEPVERLHSTLLYSRKHLPNYKPDSEINHKAEVKGLDVWKTKSGKNVLVMKINSPTLMQRHENLMAKHAGQYDFDSYEPHISLSYDIGDYDYTKIPQNALPKYINLSNEYYEPLQVEDD